MAWTRDAEEGEEDTSGSPHGKGIRHFVKFINDSFIIRSDC